MIDFRTHESVRDTQAKNEVESKLMELLQATNISILHGENNIELKYLRAFGRYAII